MLFSVGAVILFIIGVALIVGGFAAAADDKDARIIGAIGVLIGIALIVSGQWLQTHRIVNTQHVGVTRNSFSQELAGPYQSGLVKKPFFGSVYEYPSSSNYQRCEKFTPAIKGSYGVTLNLCFYYDTGNVNWLKEVNAVGSLDANTIMGTWRNSVVGEVAKSVKDYTPEALSNDRATVAASIFENVSPWFVARGVPLNSISFENWDFTSEEVAKTFDASIVSQRKITEQSALLEAAKISREREKFEAETAKIVAEQQKQALNELGLSGDAVVQYLWIKLLSEQGKAPDVLILGSGNVPVAIPPASYGGAQ